MRRSPLWRVVLASCAALAAFVLVLGTALAAVEPTTTISRQPGSVSGTPPWDVAAAEVFVESDHDGVVHYWWDGETEATVSVSAATPRSVGFAPEGIRTVSAYSVSASGTTETPAVSRGFSTDSQPPAQPADLSAASRSGGVRLDWGATADAGASGMRGYYVYRSKTDGFFQESDRISGLLTTTHFLDGDAALGKERFYAVRAVDNAGNHGFLSASLQVTHWNAVVPERIYGDDRYETALELSRANYADGSVNTVVIASGLDYPDALCASGLAGVLDSPVLLVGGGPVSGALSYELTRLGVNNAYVIGGPAAVGNDTLASIQGGLAGWVSRVWGDDRYSTAEAASDLILRLRGSDPPRAYVASGVGYPDALSVSAAAFAEGAPILYATPTGVPPETVAAYARSGADEIVIVGGTAAVWSGVDAAVPGSERVFGATRYDTSRAFADWAYGASVLRGPTLTVATGENFPDGLAAGPLAGGDEGPLLLASGPDAPMLGDWLEPRAARYTRAVIVGGTSAVPPVVHETIAVALSDL